MRTSILSIYSIYQTAQHLVSILQSSCHRDPLSITHASLFSSPSLQHRHKNPNIMAPWSQGPGTTRCAGSPSLDLYQDPTIGYQYPNSSSVSGCVCLSPPFGYYATPSFAQCCTGPVHNVTSPSMPGKLSYPAKCVAWCYVVSTLDILGNTTPDNPYGFSDLFLCLTGNSTTSSNGGVTRGFVNDPAGEASFATARPRATFASSLVGNSLAGTSSTSLLSISTSGQLCPLP